jgi:hypothetical protein
MRPKIAAALILTSLIISLCARHSGGSALDGIAPDNQVSEEKTLLLGDNTVVFLAMSQTDYEKLVAEKPEMSIVIEELMDYYHYADMLASKLERLGYKVLLGSWPEVRVQIGKNRVEKFSFKPEDRKAILMKAKAKEPKFVIGFSGDYESMAEIISEYLQIDLRIREY